MNELTISTEKETADFKKGCAMQDQADRIFMKSRLPRHHIIIAGFDADGNVKIRMNKQDYLMLPDWTPAMPVHCGYWVRGVMQGGLPA